MINQKLLRAVFATGLTFGLVACDNKPATNLSGPGQSTTTTNDPPAPPPALRPEFEKLKGKWERPDGGYVLQIRDVDAEGKMDAGYFNPSPVHVSRALAYSEAGQTKVFIELTDVNYPGSTYKLTWDAKSDQLFGLYFQAKLKQTFDVTFARLK